MRAHRRIKWIPKNLSRVSTLFPCTPREDSYVAKAFRVAPRVLLYLVLRADSLVELLALSVKINKESLHCAIELLLTQMISSASTQADRVLPYPVGILRQSCVKCVHTQPT